MVIVGLGVLFPVYVWNRTEITMYIHTTPCRSDVLDRKLQAEKSAEILSTTPDPVIMLSYITNPPGSRDYLKIVNSGKVKVSTLIPSLHHLGSIIGMINLGSFQSH